MKTRLAATWARAMNFSPTQGQMFMVHDLLVLAKRTLSLALFGIALFLGIQIATSFRPGGAAYNVIHGRR